MIWTQLGYVILQAVTNLQANIRRLLRKHGVGSWFFIYLLKKNENLLSVKEFLEVAGARVNDDKRQSGTESGLSRAAGKTRLLLLNNIYIPFLPSLYRAIVFWSWESIQ